eukprot:CAMPEP_0198710720 /NCGR_PEP_ID=MMETSP1471-20131121/2951_1 /TAXON_ID=41880 /ORGANISM="Pycnococcus provasolii, Strain RCC733" /LENGTH=339 /DNA_ID=CAMNT_0044470407 /DNA_START=189 /DNA_END=1208 /DNA_ORIENTATION=-
MSAALVHLDDRREVPAAVAVVRCREHGHDTVVVHPVESLHDKLVRPCDELQTICVVELLRDVLPKRVPCTSRRDSPTTPVLWVTPQKVADRTFVRNFREAVKCVDVVDGVEARAKPGVWREDLALHARGEWQVVEKVGDERPNARGSIFPQALVVEAINLRDLPGLVVSTDDSDAVWPPHFHGDHHEHRLNAVVPAIDVVTQEEEVGFRRLSCDVEEFEQVVELSVHVSDNGDRARHGLYVFLPFEDFLAFFAQLLHFLLREWLDLRERIDLPRERFDVRRGQLQGCTSCAAHFDLILYKNREKREKKKREVKGRLTSMGPLRKNNHHQKRQPPPEKTP